MGEKCVLTPDSCSAPVFGCLRTYEMSDNAETAITSHSIRKVIVYFNLPALEVDMSLGDYFCRL